MAPSILRTPLYLLSLQFLDESVEISMQICGSVYHTHHLPHVVPVLRQQLPAVLQTQCFNDAHLPFSEEVKATEIGHLLEHMVLAKMVELAMTKGKSMSFRGSTSWNWQTDAQGTYHISLATKRSQGNLVIEALHETLPILDSILSSTTKASGIATTRPRQFHQVTV